MPVYLFKHPGTEEIREVTQRMKEDHVYTDESGAVWERIFTVPAAGVDGRIDSFSNTEFVEKTRGKGMTMGQLWEESKAASEKREKTLGKDPIREEHFENYSKKRRGMKHREDPLSS